MNLKQFLKPDLKKVVIFLISLLVVPFPYFARERVGSMQFCEKPPCIISLNMIGVITFNWEDLPQNIPLYFVHLICVYLLACIVIWSYNKFRKKK